VNVKNDDAGSRSFSIDDLALFTEGKR